MQKIELCMQNEEGLHARPAMEFASKAAKYQCDVSIEKDGMSFDAKSVLMVLSACVCQNDIFTLKVEGPDEVEAATALTAFVKEIE